MDNIQIIPAILANTEEEYKEKLEKLEAIPELSEGWVQIDLMDNKFVQNKSISPDIISKHPTSFKREVHLMVEYPENWIEDLVNVKVERIIFPVEADGVQEKINHIKNHGVEVGLSLNPETPVEKVLPFVSTIEVVLVMSVHPGFDGQEFIPESIEKIREAARLRSKNSNLVVEVDGGVDEGVVKSIVEAGADNLIIGSHLINGDTEENLEKIWERIYS